ncbi:MAG: diguanylate cyclase [Gudongella sp.]|nr:diguanylate cyclase [Gudongella sp.]
MNNREKKILNYIISLLFDTKITNSMPAELLDSEDLCIIDETLRIIRDSIYSIGFGDLSSRIDGQGYTIGIIKNLQASLKNLTWQTKAIALGDFSQHVDFLGEFSDAFNSMTKKLEYSLQEVHKTKELFEMVFETIPDATIIISLDEGNIFDVNTACCNLSGYEKNELIGQNVLSINFIQDLDQLNDLQKTLEDNNFCNNKVIDLITKDNKSILGLFSSQVILIENKKYVLSVIKDITQRIEMENRLRDSEERHRLLADNISDVIWTMDIDGRFTYISPSVQKVRGFTVAEVMKQSKEELLCPESVKYMDHGLIEAVNSVQNNLPFKTFRADLEQPCKDGTTIWMDTTISGIYDKDKRFIGMVGVSRDISDRKQMEEKIRRLSITDKLTQLNNRLRLDDALKNEVKRIERSHSISSLIILDIDYFKRINDKYGHPIGDSVLVELASILKNNIRELDVLGRWGGEEFMIILPSTDKNGAIVCSNKLREKIANYNFQDVGEVTASFGIAEIKKGITAEEIVAKADAALYRAKDLGRNKVVSY